MSSANENEITGDWNNLKGTEYHLVYALWLLLYRKVASVAFYLGNDLLARPITPPLLYGSQTVVALQVQLNPEEDEWIQLKATEKPWSISALLREQDNLLANFMCNALSSERAGRPWQVQLITQGSIQQKEIQHFLDNPREKPELWRNLTNIIAKVQRRWQKEGWGVTDDEHLHQIAFTILRQQAEIRPFHLETLKAQIETQLAYACYTPEVVRLTGEALLGALLQDAASGPKHSPVYTVEWVERVAQRPLVLRTLLVSDPMRACTEVLESRLPSNWDAKYAIPRLSLVGALEQFLTARETLFVLTGWSGVGKSWSVIDWMTRILDGEACLLLRGSDLDSQRELRTLIAGKLHRFAPADWSDERCFRHLQVAAGVQRHGFLTITIDDLHFPVAPDEVSRFVRYLGRLIEECREQGIKLVLTCQKHVWDTYSSLLSRAISPTDIFPLRFEQGTNPKSETEQQSKSFNFLLSDAPMDTFPLELEQRLLPKLEPEQPGKLYSFLLGDLVFEEVVEVFKRRYSATMAERIALQLWAPSFAPLRNPYLLNLYLQQYGEVLGEPNETPAPVEVDALVDKHVENALLSVASNLVCDLHTVRKAFQALQHLLWEERTTAVTSLRAAKLLADQLLEPGNAALREIQNAGLVTIVPTGSVELTEPTVSARLFARDLELRLRKGEDILDEILPEVDTDTMSSLLRLVPDPVLLAEKLVGRDHCWVMAVAKGLAQVKLGGSNDYKILAFLSVLTKFPDKKSASLEVFVALGQLAAREKSAWEWVTGLYLSDRIIERFQGGWALSTTTEFAPERVETVMRRRLELARKINDTKKEKREQWLQSALSPLLRFNNRSIAAAGKRLAHEYDLVVGEGESRLGQELLRDIDEVRGRTALLSGPDELNDLLMELENEEPLVRYRAASALRPILFEHPETLIAALCSAIRRERNAWVMNRLLWSVYRLEEVAPNDLLDVIEGSFVVQWHEQYTTAAITLALLGDMANRDSSRVLRLLPPSFEEYPSTAQALLSEMLTYAWWRCSEYIPDAQSHFTTLLLPDLSDIPNEYRIFALRGAAIAQLGRMCLDAGISSRELVGLHTSYPLEEAPAYYLNLDEFIPRHAATLREHPRYHQLCELLMSCLHEQINVMVHPGYRGLINARYFCACSCEDILDHLDAGENHFHHVRQGNIANSLDRILGRGHELEMARLCKAPSSEVLPSLERVASLSDEALLAILYFWKEETHSWFSLLIARVYARMFNISPIDRSEALQLCAQMLEGLGTLPDNPLQQEYMVVYTALSKRLKGDNELPPAALLSPTGKIQHAHAYAIEILQSAEGEKRSGWLTEALQDRRGWLETTRFQLKDQSPSFGTSTYFLYVFPAVRLALIAAGREDDSGDLAAQFMKGRIQVNKLLVKHRRVLSADYPVDHDRQQVALTAFKRQLEDTPYDERLWQCTGSLFLRIGDFAEAEKTLLHCLSMPSCSQESKANVYYDLACVYARLSKEVDCQRMLQISFQLRPINQFFRDWLSRDPDLEGLREKVWFWALLEEEVNGL